MKTKWKEKMKNDKEALTIEKKTIKKAFENLWSEENPLDRKLVFSKKAIEIIKNQKEGNEE